MGATRASSPNAWVEPPGLGRLCDVAAAAISPGDCRLLTPCLRESRWYIECTYSRVTGMCGCTCIFTRNSVLAKAYYRAMPAKPQDIRPVNNDCRDASVGAIEG